MGVSLIHKTELYLRDYIMPEYILWFKGAPELLGVSFLVSLEYFLAIIIFDPWYTTQRS